MDGPDDSIGSSRLSSLEASAPVVDGEMLYFRFWGASPLDAFQRILAVTLLAITVLVLGVVTLGVESGRSCRSAEWRLLVNR
jgi:hypothetical protein